MTFNRRPLVWKIFFTYIATAVVIVVSLGFFMRLFIHGERGPGTILLKNANEYTDYLIQTIGDPPRLSEMKRLSEKLDLQIRVESPGGVVQTSELEPIQSYREDVIHWVREREVGKRNGRFFVIRTQGETSYLFMLWEDPFGGKITRHVIAILFFIVIVFVMSFLTVRWILKPMRQLLIGVQKVSSGDLNYRIAPRCHDEFRTLSEAFNQMLDRIKGMLEAKDQLLVDVSHELRSPLTRMKVATEMLPAGTMRTHLDGDLRELETLIDEILEGYRNKSPNGSLQREPVKIVPLVEEVANAYSVVLISEVESSLEINVDPKKMKRALQNLIQNAVKFSSDQPRPVEVKVKGRESEIAISVRDYGAGIPEDELTRIFEPFYRLDRSRTRQKNYQTGGFGLGLSIVRTLVEAHGGKIRVESKLGEGSEFTISLPGRL